MNSEMLLSENAKFIWKLDAFSMQHELKWVRTRLNFIKAEEETSE